MIEVHKIMKLRGVLMMWKFHKGRLGQWWKVLPILLSISVLFSINLNFAQAQTISYPAKLQGCAWGSPFSHYTRPTCSEAIPVYFTDPGATGSCVPDIITKPQPVTCEVTIPYPQYGYTHNFTTLSWMYPLYICEYGPTEVLSPPYDLGGINGGIEPFTCNIHIDNTHLITFKNLGNHSSCVGNPVQHGIGNKYAPESDYVSSSLIFNRHYNSQQNKLNRHIGSLWQHTYNTQLKIIISDTSSVVFAERSDGQTLFFTLENNQWISDEDIPDQLFELPDGNWQLMTSDDTTETYNVNGKLLSITNRTGRTQTLTYDANDRLITVSDDIGRTLEFSYDSSKRIETMTDPAGGLYHYYYDTIGNLIAVTYPDNRTRTYHYNEPAYTSGANLPNALTGITDENGIRYATYTYDTQGRAIITEHAGGADRHELTYSDDGSSTVVTDPLGSEYTRQFETILGVAKSTGQSQPAGSGCSAASSATTYDVNGNVASRTDFNGNKTCYAYDLDRNLEVARLEGLAAGSVCPDVINYTPAANTDERKTLTDWHFEFRVPLRVTEMERETSIDYDSYANVTRLSIRDTKSNETRSWNKSYAYHPTVPGVVIQRIEDGPRSDVSDITTIDYYAPDENCLGGHFGCRSQVSRATNALGHITEITRYNAHGQPEEIIAPNGLHTTLVYDVRQRLISRTSGTETTRYDYDGVGQLIRITSPDNSTLTYTYDDAHRQVGVQDTLGNAIHYTLDAMGNRTEQKVLDAAGQLAQTQQQEFDALSRLWKMIGAQNQTTEFAYDANGNLKQATNPMQQSASNSFDALDRLIQSTDAMGGQTLQQHDALDQLAKVTDPKGIDTTYTTNALGDVLQEVSADRGTTTYTYDAAGNLTTRNDARGVVQSITYDALNRPISQSYATVANVPATTATTWRYDEGSNNIGRLTSMRDASGSTTYQYDLQGRLLNKNQSVLYGNESFVHALSFSYDNSGRLSQTIYPSGAKINTVYDANGRPAEIHVNGKVLLQNITYHPFGAPKSWIWGNGQPHNRTFDLDGRLVEHPLGSDTQTLTYDAASRIIATNQTDPIYNRWYDYDALDRLTRQSDNVSTRLWGYDANSNRTHVQSGATTYPYTLDPASNRLLAVAGPEVKTYTDDAAGNALSDGTLDFTWNAAGRMTNASTRNSITDYRYNGHGERVLKQSQRRTRGGPYMYVYNTAGQLIGDYAKAPGGKQTVNWLQQQETVWLGDIPVAVIKQPKATEPAQVYFIHSDHLNTPRLIADQSNTTIWRWNNKNAFGNNPPDEDPDGDRKRFEYNLRFAGQYFDTETNLHYNYFRDYEPVTGRYISSDPIGLAGGLNTYGYVLNNPLKYIDPYGLDITVSFNPNAAAGFGHVGLGVNTPNTVGQRPQPGASSIQASLGMNVPGLISLDPTAPSNITILTTPEQDQNAQQCIDTRTQQQQDYNLYNNNCTQFVSQCLGAAGINTPNTIFPRTLFNNLQQNFGGNP